MKFLEKVWDALGLYEHVETVEEDIENEPAPTPVPVAAKPFQRSVPKPAVAPPTAQEPQAQPTWLARKSAPAPANNLVSLPVANKQIKVVVMAPKQFDDAQPISDHIRSGKPVVVNFEGIDPEVMKRIIDFISGTVYAINGNIQLVGKNMMICAPNNVDIDANKDFFIGKDFKPWKD